MKKFDSINVIPFIDIMLVLLAIVLTTATFVSNGQLDIDLPQSTSNAPPVDQEQLEIAIDRDNTLYLDGNTTTIEQLESSLAVEPPDRSILLVIDEAVEFKQFVSVVDILNSLQLDKVSVLTRKDN